MSPAKNNGTKGERRRPKQTQRSSATVAPAPHPALLVDLRVAAGMLGVTLWQVRTLIWSHKLTPVRLGRRFLLDPEDLRAFVARQKGGDEHSIRCSRPGLGGEFKQTGIKQGS